MPKLHALDLIAREPWLITDGALERISAIAQRLHDAPAGIADAARARAALTEQQTLALATRPGTPLEGTRSATLHGDTALIPITGPIFRYANLMTEISGATSLEVLAQDFQAALDHPRVRSIVLSIDSPGGQAAGIAEFAAAVRKACKPTAAYVGDLGASAAYWIAAAADRVVVSPTAMLGSIGVAMTYRPPTDRTDGKTDVEIVSTASPLKRVTPDTDLGRQETQRIVDALAAVFIADVARARGVSQETVTNDFGRGGLLVGEDAVAAGMADQIGSLAELLAGRPTGTTSSRIITMSTPEPTALPPVLDRATLAAEHPALFAALLEEGRLEGRTQERQRILEIRAHGKAFPGHAALIDQFIADGATSGHEAAVAILQAEAALRIAAQAGIASAPPPVPTALAPAPGNAPRASVTLLDNHRRATGGAA